MYDLVDIDIHRARPEENGSPGKRSQRGTGPKAKGRCSEDKAAEAFLNSIDGLSFNPETFAFFLAQAEPIIQHRILNIFVAWVEVWDQYWEAGSMNDGGDLESLGIMIHKISEALDDL